MGYSSVLFGLARVYHGRRETAALGIQEGSLAVITLQ
jgi:hypothetical protein